MTSPLDSAPVLTNTDRQAEAATLRTYDVAQLRERFHRSLQRRAFLGGFATGVVTAFGVAVLTWAVSGSRHVVPDPLPNTMPDTVVSHAKAECPVVSTRAQTMAPPAPVPAPRVVVREVRVEVPGACPLPDARALDEDVAGVEGSPLRTQLRIFADAERALADGDSARALARATHLQAQFGRGPLQIDAMLLEIRALRALGRIDEARAALTRAEAHAQAAEKSEVLEELRTLLLVHTSGALNRDSSVYSRPYRDAGAIDTEEPGDDAGAPSDERSPQ